jgi:hypothetical protein
MELVVRLEIGAERGNSASSSDMDALRTQLQALVSTLEANVDSLAEAELQGRMYSDVAFRLALSGVDDAACIALLARGAVAELRRFGHRNSCRPTDIYHIVERLACAGSLDQTAALIAADLLEKKLPLQALAAHMPSIAALRSGAFNLLCDRPLLLLWTYSSHQHKSGKQFHQIEKSTSGSKRNREENSSTFVAYEASSLVCTSMDTNILPSAKEIAEGVQFEASDLDISKLFADPSLPLVIDLGCGYGVSILGLCYDQHMRPSTTSPHTVYNFLGCDMSSKAVRYGRSIAKQWGMDSNIAFVYMESSACLEAVRKTYVRSKEANECRYAGDYEGEKRRLGGGPVHRILAQFPTPFAFGTLTRETYPACFQPLEDSSTSIHSGDSSGRPQGNKQLPTDILAFMITGDLISRIASLFEESREYFEGGSFVDPLLYVQSNIEDVAVFLRNMISGVGVVGASCFEVVDSLGDAMHIWGQGADYQTAAEVALSDVPPRRQELWRASGGLPAEGPGWLSKSPLPLHARTETELLYAQDRKSVHRLLFAFKKVAGPETHVLL